MTISLNLLLIAFAAAIILAVVSILLGILLRRRPRSLNRNQFKERWRNLQNHCAQEATWPMAVIDADKLLDDALKRLHYRGKTMGERMVSAQRDIKSNDMVWFSHKLRNKIVHENIRLKKRDVQNALKGYMQALHDLGAL
jgi:hypothetical protein